MSSLSKVTYIWIDGTVPTKKARSKTRIIQLPQDNISINDFPQWGFDGSSTYQAQGDSSDLLLQPVAFVANPLTVGHDFLVLCEVLNPDDTPHSSNTRARLREVMQHYAHIHEPWIGFEQEYTLFKDARPLGWPEQGYPAPQGPFYCGVGADEVFGRDLVLQHAQACMDAGLMLFGVNAEVMPGQWEFQIGYRGVNGESADPLTVSDHLWLARWLLYRIGEEYAISVKLDPKPVKGDWNGAGKHTNFSTKSMRNQKTGIASIQQAIDKLAKQHSQHISVYGYGLEHRLTGLHETAPISEFRYGVSDRGASIRIPASVAANGYGYLEDRRPGANADPYEVSRVLIETICE